jgi:hypothetical protein
MSLDQVADKKKGISLSALIFGAIIELLPVMLPPNQIRYRV